MEGQTVEHVAVAHDGIYDSEERVALGVETYSMIAIRGFHFKEAHEMRIQNEHTFIQIFVKVSLQRLSILLTDYTFVSCPSSTT